jgi:hypothetical protein
MPAGGLSVLPLDGETVRLRVKAAAESREYWLFIVAGYAGQMSVIEDRFHALGGSGDEMFLGPLPFLPFLLPCIWMFPKAGFPVPELAAALKEMGSRETQAELEAQLTAGGDILPLIAVPEDLSHEEFEGFHVAVICGFADWLGIPR